MIINKNKLLILIVITISLFLPLSRASALSLYAEHSSREIKVGDTVLINFYLDTEGVEINVLEGKIRVVGEVSIKSVSSGGSVFTIWQTQPTILGNEITFVGGTPTSVKGKENKVFTVAIKPLGVGDIQLEPLPFQGYLADGKGTIVVGRPSKFESIVVLESAGQPIDESASQSRDTVPPNPFTIEIGREGGSTDGKLFLSFISSDDGSGIKYYEVKEGDKITTVSQGIYVLQNQTYSGEVTVTAFDNAGNMREQTINLGKINNRVNSSWIIYLIGLLLITLVGYLWIRYNKKKS